MTKQHEELIREQLQRIESEIAEQKTLLDKISGSALYTTKSACQDPNDYTVDDYKAAKNALKKLEREKKRFEEYLD